MTPASQYRRAGAMALAAGVVVAVVVTAYPENLRAPAWVAYLASALAAAGGAISLARGFARPALADAFACLFLAGALAMELWIAIGPGPRHCLGRIGASGPGAAASELACRSAFGLGAVLVAAMLVMAIRGLLRRLRRG